jgi:hypothetical protein
MMANSTSAPALARLMRLSRFSRSHALPRSVHPVRATG